MKGFGQFCPLALAAEVLCERWSLLILREIMLGSGRFNEIHRGVPRMSPTLLAQRLRRLERAGILVREPAGGASRYALTEAGAALEPVVESLAVWGKTWLPATLSQEQADPDFVMWDMHRRMDPARLPERRTVLRFDFTDQPMAKRHRWLVGTHSDIELCITDPGFEVDLLVTTDSRTLTWIWYGDIPLRRALEQERVVLDGPAHLCTAFPALMPLSALASVPRRRPA